MLGREVKVSPEWRKEVEAQSGIIPYLRTTLSSLNSAGAVVTVVGGAVLLFPTVISTLGLAATAGVVFGPALLIAVIAGFSAYKEAAKAKEQEKLLKQQFEELISAAENDLSDIQAKIDEACHLLNNKTQEAMSNATRQQLITTILKAIEAVRVLTKNTDYEKEKYANLIEAHDAISTTGVYQPTIVLPQPPKKTGFFAGLYQDTKNFFTELNDYRKTNGLGLAVFEFLGKTWQVMSPFLGGAGLGLTLGAAAIGVTTMALGTGASFTGIGAIGGLPAVGVGVILLGGAVLVGLIGAGIKYFISKRQQQKLNGIKTVTTTISTANLQYQNLNKEINNVRGMQATQMLAKESDFEQREKRISEKEQELALKERELELKAQRLNEREAILRKQEPASEETIYKALNAVTAQLFNPATSTATPTNDAILNEEEKEKKSLGS